jgi:hypothetical protein
MRRLLPIILLIVISLHAYGRKIKGVIISNGRTLDVMFDIKVPFLAGEPNFERTQYRVRYYDQTGKKQTLRPDDADEIRFDFDGMQIRMISVPNTIGAGSLFANATKIFLKLEIDGPLRLYRYYYKQSTGGSFGTGGGYYPGATYTADNLIFQKGNGPLKQPRSIGWKKDMLEYFSDCPDLRERIESKDLRRKEIEAIVLYYNRQCAQK